MVKKRSKSTKKVIAPVVIMVCEDHKNYKATYPPGTDCLVCWKIYATRMCLEVKRLKMKLKELKNVKRQ